ncbi:histone-lysine N-methyltransferase SETMAR-like [Ptiloglossa arizonensis]|uniref:histone-lysine N-methyltransferase SETMAR-like n=1 Tax=Ptiloglossa arizonensis TaxID=3350558 RepID=UPI003F9F21AC
MEYQMQQQSGDETRSVRPIVENVAKIMEMAGSDRHASTYSISQELKISQKTGWNHLRKASLKKKLDVRVPHELTQKNLFERIDTCDYLLKRNEIDPFLKRMGILHYELLPSGQSLNSDLYCQQLTRLKQSIDEKRPELANRKGVAFHEDNARPHTSLTTRQKLRELGWEVISYPPYSPDQPPSDYHLFKHLQNFLHGKRLA